MFESFVLLLILVTIVGALFFVFKVATKVNKTYAENGVGKIVATIPLNCKLSAHIVKVMDKYYLLCEGCGILEIDYSNKMEQLIENNTFQNVLAKEFAELKNFQFKKNSDL